MTPRLCLRALGDVRLETTSGDDLLGRRLTDLALLVVLVDRAPAAVRRDELLAMFWGERPEEKARHSLRQVVARLREACGDALEADTTSLKLRRDAIDCDVQAFTAAATSGAWRDAIAKWSGEFLTGCELVGGEGFRVWLDVERERLRRLLSHCYECAASELEAREDWTALSECATSWVERFPLDEHAHRSHIAALCKRGSSAQAVAAQSAFVRLLRAEMDESPSAEWTAATDRLVRDARESGVASPEPVAKRPRERVELPPAVAAEPARIPQRRRRNLFPTLAVAALAVTALLGARIATARPGKPPAIAIGEITSSLSPDSTRGFAMLLTIDLSRIPEMDVIGERRLSEVAAGRGTDKFDAIARRAGAREIIEGVLSRRPDGAMRVDLRRSDLASGKTRAAYTLEGADLSQLADLISEAVARDFHLQARVSRREAVTSSILAYGFYEQGLRAYYQGDDGAARRFFTGALAEDSTFAMAALYKSFTAGIDSGDVYAAQALRHAQHTNDRERLLITLTWGRRMNDPRVLAWADSLITLYPSELDAHLIYAREMINRSNLTAAAAHYRYVLEADSANVRREARCRACDAAGGLAWALVLMDSTAAAEHLLRTWLEWEPGSVNAWHMSSNMLDRAGRFADAHASLDSVVKYSHDPGAPLEHTVVWFHADELEPIDKMWRELEQSTKPSVRQDALWTHMIASRTEGRMRDALDASRAFRRASLADHNSYSGSAMPEALALLDAGRFRESAALFDSCARQERGVPAFASRLGATRAWDWTHAATAYAAAGDTAALRWLEDSVRVNGSLAADRYRRLYHYVHGLRLSAAHRPAEAAIAFREALPVDRGETYVRIPLELARSLMDAGRPTEAIAPLVEALKGPTSFVGLYATRSDLHELLGAAYERSHMPDSAVAEYRHAVRAWRDADPELAQRRARLESRVMALSALRPVGQ